MNECNFHGFPKSIRVYHGSCFPSNEFKKFCEKNNISLILCKVGDHKSDGAIEPLIYTVKAKLLFNELKQTLNAAIEKISWNLL